MKLYTIADSCLPKAQQYVQATHAVAQYLIDNPDTEWNNDTLIMLKCKEYIREIDDLLESVEIWDMPISKFYEPYYNNRLTAFCGLDIGWMYEIKELELI